MFAVLSFNITNAPFSFLYKNRKKRMVYNDRVKLVQDWVVLLGDTKGMTKI